MYCTCWKYLLSWFVVKIELSLKGCRRRLFNSTPIQHDGQSKGRQVPVQGVDMMVLWDELDEFGLVEFYRLSLDEHRRRPPQDVLRCFEIQFEQNSCKSGWSGDVEKNSLSGDQANHSTYEMEVVKFSGWVCLVEKFWWRMIDDMELHEDEWHPTNSRQVRFVDLEELRWI